MVTQALPPRDVAEKLKRGEDFILLDCREPEELQIARIERARHIPMGDIPVRIKELDPQKEIVVFCHHGRRSANVCAFLREHAYSRVLNMTGGIAAWSADVDPRVPQY